MIKLIKKIIFLCVLLVVAFHLLVAAMLLLWKVAPVTNSMFMLDHRLHGGNVEQTWVDYDKIAKSAKQAAIASEDGKFVSHHGFDMDGIENAIKKIKKVVRYRQGGRPLPNSWQKTCF